MATIKSNDPRAVSTTRIAEIDPRPMAEDFPTRLKKLIGERSVRSFSRDCGISETVLRKYLRGDSEPTRSRLLSLARTGHASVEWLATGEGPMTPADPKEWSEAVRDHGSGTAGLDFDLLHGVLQALEEVMAATKPNLSTEKRAQIIVAVYDLYAGAGHAPDATKLRRLIITAM